MLSAHVIGSASCGILELIDTEIFVPLMMFRIAMQAEVMQLQISGGVGVLVQPLDHLGHHEIRRMMVVDYDLRQYYDCL